MRLILLPIFACALAAQTPDAATVFEVASVKHGPPGDFSVGGTGCPSADPTRCFVENYPMSSLLEMAFDLKSYQLAGPSWIEAARFTINCKAPEGTTKKQLMVMLQNLLRDRFRLAAHFETKDAPGYQLVAAKGGPKLAASPGAAKPVNQEEAKRAAPVKLKVDPEGFPQLPPGRHFSMAIDHDRERWHFVDESMEDFTDVIGNQMIHQPTTNATGLKGKYDFDLFWNFAAMQPNAPVDAGPDLFQALRDQLGLRLEAKKIPVATLVVEHLEKTPSEN